MRFLIVLVLIGAATAKPVSDRILDSTCQHFLDKSGVDYGFFPDIVSCSSYFQCYRVTVNGVMHYMNRVNSCPQNTVWNQQYQSCQWDLNGNGCETDPCDYSDAPFADTENCGSYYVCVNDDPIKMCCPPGMGYNSVSGQCDNTGCAEICEQLDLNTNETAPNVTTLADNECINGDNIYSVRTIKDGVSEYYISDLLKTKTEVNRCPHDAPLFDIAQCGCVRTQNSPPAGSPSETCYVYDYTQTYGMMKDGTSHWVDAKNAQIVNGALCVAADGLVQIPFFTSNSFGNSLRLGFRMDIDSVDMNSGIIITNGDDITRPSVEVKIDSGDMVVTLATDNTCTIRHPFNEGSSTATITYDGNELAVDIAQGLIAQSIVRTTPCVGDIKVTNDPIRLGVGLTGCIDDVTICKK